MQKKIILSKDQVAEIVQANKYQVDDKSSFISRCIDGRYPTSSSLTRLRGAGPENDNLPPLALAGADLGELALIKAAGNTYGFEVDLKKTYQVLVELLGGIDNFQMHTDGHGDPTIAAAGCGHLKQMKLDPGAYHLTDEDILTLSEIAEDAKKKGATEVKLEGDHIEGAVLQVTGNYSVKTRYFLENNNGTREVEVFVFHETFVSKRHKELAKRLIEKKAVILVNGLDAEYLSEMLSEATEDHLMETAKRLAKGLPIYLATFAEDGGFDLTEMGTV